MTQGPYSSLPEAGRIWTLQRPPKDFRLDAGSIYSESSSAAVLALDCGAEGSVPRQRALRTVPDYRGKEQSHSFGQMPMYAKKRHARALTVFENEDYED